MKAITIRDLHDRTEQLVQEAARRDGFVITEQGEPLAVLTAARGARRSGKPLPHRDPATLPTTSADSTIFVSEDRNGR
ncbi:MAG: type II toxin-antitoxin system prevent-host-death family antitoxin [Verrucomicrobia bacterium]|nr:type II toxin-antitoxin system prevent-host-death family antitoxin [Verrucomicrobiota bacterium]